MKKTLLISLLGLGALLISGCSSTGGEGVCPITGARGPQPAGMHAAAQKQSCCKTKKSKDAACPKAKCDAAKAACDKAAACPEQSAKCAAAKAECAAKSVECNAAKACADKTKACDKTHVCDKAKACDKTKACDKAEACDKAKAECDAAKPAAVKGEAPDEADNTAPAVTGTTAGTAPVLSCCDGAAA